MMMIRLFRIGCQTKNTFDAVVNTRCYAHAESHIMVFRPVYLVKIGVYCTAAVEESREDRRIPSVGSCQRSFNCC